MKALFKTLFALTAAFAAHAVPAGAADVELWRLDCGQIAVSDLGAFSDAYDYAGVKRTLTDSCYLIRHGSDYMLWDSGLPATFVGAKQDPAALMAPTLTADLVTQLARIGVKPAQIGRLGISHNHFDHTGQAASFPKAVLMIGAADFAAFRDTPAPFGVDAGTVKPWLDGTSKVETFATDHDVFGDGSVTMLAMPGHTPGEMALLVRLSQTGAVLLSGDVVHFEEQFAHHGVPGFNASRADSLASMVRLQEIAANLHAILVVQHDPNDIARLPAFPQSAR